MTDDEVAQGREPTGPGPFAPGGRHRRSLTMAAVVVAFLVVIAVVGVFRDSPQPKPGPTATPQPSASTAGTGTGTGPALVLATLRCARLVGSTLTVGFSVTNQGSTALTVRGVTPSFPLGGFTPAAVAAALDPATCRAAPTPLPAALAPREQALLGLVLTATDPRCVAPLPVDVRVAYDVDGHGPISENFHAFADLGGLGLPGECNGRTGG